MVHVYLLNYLKYRRVFSTTNFLRQVALYLRICRRAGTTKVTSILGHYIGDIDIEICEFSDR